MEKSSEKRNFICNLDFAGRCDYPCNNDTEMMACVKKELWKELNLTTSKEGPKLFEVRYVACT